MRSLEVVRLSIVVTALTTPLAAPAVAAPDPAATAEALATLKIVLAHKPASLAALADQPFAKIALTRIDAAIAHTLIWTAQLDDLRKQRTREIASGVIRDGNLAMPFTFKVFGPRPGPQPQLVDLAARRRRRPPGRQ